MEYVYDVYLLSDKFINDYSEEKYPELMCKQGRPYTCLLVDTHDDYYICIPFRSSISHNNAYLFQSTQRSKKSRSGLDYTKVVLIKDDSYISGAVAVVDNDEYNEAVKNIDTIVKDITKYIDTYIQHINGTKEIHLREFQRKYKYSTLPYFHNILGL